MKFDFLGFLNSFRSAALRRVKLADQAERRARKFHACADDATIYETYEARESLFTIDRIIAHYEAAALGIKHYE